MTFRNLNNLQVCFGNFFCADITVSEITGEVIITSPVRYWRHKYLSQVSETPLAYLQGL